MKKIIPFKKDLFFKDNVYEIVSISLEHTLHHEKDYLISGEFLITGDYKITDSSINVENFEFKIPFDINIDEHYNLDHLIIDIDDFYYEIVNNNVLRINIEVLLDKLEENRCIEIEDDVIELLPVENIEEPINILKEEIEEINSNVEEAKGFVTYKVYIVKEEDTIEKIYEKYKISRELLEKYNDLKEIKIGDKIIIPSND